MNGRMLACDIETGTGFKCAICAVYAPNDDSPAYFEALDQNLCGLHWNKCIIGDFNLVMDVKMDRHNSHFNNHKACSCLKEYMVEQDMADVWRIRNPHDKFYSWRNATQTRASRIDMCLLSHNLQQLCENCMYSQGVMSDHSSMFVSIKDCQTERGPGYWKVNNQIISKNKGWIMSQLKKDVCSIQDRPPLKRWEFIKQKLTNYLKTAAQQCADENNIIIAQLAECISNYELSFPLPEANFKIYLQTKEDFKQKLEEKARTIIFCSGAWWAENGEKPTKYFMNLEKSRSCAKSCQALINEQGELITDLPSIMKEQCKFYSRLYESDSSINFTCLNNSSQELSATQISFLNVDINF